MYKIINSKFHQILLTHSLFTPINFTKIKNSKFKYIKCSHCISASEKFKWLLKKY